MINITSSDMNLSIMKTQTSDQVGDPAVEIQISAPGFVTIEAEVNLLKETVNQIKQQQEFDMALIMGNPALKDAYMQYRVMLGLVKDAESD